MRAEVLVIDEDARARVVEHVLMLARVQADVHGDHAAAGLHRSEQRLEALAAVGGQHADPITAPRAERDERVRETIHAGLCLAERDDDVPFEPGGALGPAVGGAGQEVADVHI